MVERVSSRSGFYSLSEVKRILTCVRKTKAKSANACIRKMRKRNPTKRNRRTPKGKLRE